MGYDRNSTATAWVNISLADKEENGNLIWVGFDLHKSDEARDKALGKRKKTRIHMLLGIEH